MSSKIRIDQYAFSLPLRYRAGHSLSQNEADALNGLRAENIRNNVKRWVDEAKKSVPLGELLTPDALSALQDRVSEYAASYEFGAKAEPKGGTRKTSFEVELLAIAKERVEEQARSLGIELSEEGLQAAIESQTKLAIVIEEARRRVAAKNELAQQALQSLLE